MRNCETCTAEFEPVGRQRVCTACIKVNAMESKKKWADKNKLASLDVDKAVDKMYNDITSRAVRKPAVEKEEFKALSETVVVDKPMEIVHVWSGENLKDVDLYFKDVDRAFEWLKGRFVETRSMTDIEIEMVEVL